MVMRRTNPKFTAIRRNRPVTAHTVLGSKKLIPPTSAAEWEAALQTMPPGAASSSSSSPFSFLPRAAWSTAVERRMTMVSCYTYPAAKHCDDASIDMILVGDSVGMVDLGYSGTQPVTMEEMIHHCKAVSRGAGNCLVVGDMPFGSYEVNDDLAVQNAFRLVKEGGAGAVKMEGAGQRRTSAAKAIVEAGIPVMAHIGLTPQSAQQQHGSFRSQGTSLLSAKRLVRDAVDMDRAGCFAVVAECVPAALGGAMSRATRCPIVGIGAGGATDAQVLVLNDMIGYSATPTYLADSASSASSAPSATGQKKDSVAAQPENPDKLSFTSRKLSFVKPFANVGEAIQLGLQQYHREVGSGQWPGLAPVASTGVDPEVQALRPSPNCIFKMGGGDSDIAALLQWVREQDFLSASVNGAH